MPEIPLTGGIGLGRTCLPLVKPTWGRAGCHSTPFSTPILVLVCLLKEFLLLEHSQWLKASFHVSEAMHLFYMGFSKLITW